jgi:Zn finger protein HypA/HybF involved in hydrogenase expression
VLLVPVPVVPAMITPIIIPCRACGSEGRIYHGDGSHRLDWVEPCSECDGTGGEIIEGDDVELEDIAEFVAEGFDP